MAQCGCIFLLCPNLSYHGCSSNTLRKKFYVIWNTGVELMRLALLPPQDLTLSAAEINYRLEVDADYLNC